MENSHILTPFYANWMMLIKLKAKSGAYHTSNNLKMQLSKGKNDFPLLYDDKTSPDTVWYLE